MSTDKQLQAADAAFKAAWDEYFDRLESSYPEQLFSTERANEARTLAQQAWWATYLPQETP